MKVLSTLAWRNMWRNWRRTAIALTAIVLGVLLLLLLDGLIKGSDQAIFGNAVRLYGGNVMIHAPGYRERATRQPLLPLDDPAAAVAAATKLEGVTAVHERLNTSGLVSKRGASHAVSISGVEPASEAADSIAAANIGTGRFLLEGEGDAIVIGRGLANLLEVGVGDDVSVLARGENEATHQRSMTVVGIYDLGMPEAEKGLAFIALPQAQDLLRMRDQISEVALMLDKVGNEDATVATLQPQLPGAEVDSWVTLRPEIRTILEQKQSYTTFFGAIVVFIAGIGVLNVLLMAVFERTREMGILAALGMRGRQIMALFILEGSMIGVVGAVLGCVVGLLAVGLLAQVGIDLSYAQGIGGVAALMGDRLYPAVDPADVVRRALFVLVIAAGASVYPAWIAARKPPAEVLHHV